MSQLPRLYFFTLRVFGFVLIFLMVSSGIARGFQLDIWLLVLLGIVAAWLRFSLAPIGYVTLTPVVSFTALVIYSPFAALLVTIISSLIGSRLFGRSRWHRSIEETGEESISMIVSVGVFQSTAGGQAVSVAFMSALITYVLFRILFTVARGKLQDDIAVASTLSAASKYIFGNLLLFGFVAYGIAVATPTYGRFGLLALGLATIALAEFYRPWKLLSQQADDMFLSLAIIAEAIDIKDPYTGRHSRRVADLATKLARRLRLPEQEVSTIRVAALMHDIGKIGVSGSIIRKPGTLEPKEREAMQQHPAISANIMEPVDYFKNAAALVRHHHEHYDGTGYPLGLVGQDIPIGSRIILVADAFDALTTDRPYRKGRGSKDALLLLEERAGKQFDARVVTALTDVLSAVTPG